MILIVGGIMYPDKYQDMSGWWTFWPFLIGFTGMVALNPFDERGDYD